MKRILKDNKGFTLVELLAVICIMAILLIVAVPAINALLFNSRTKMYVQSAGVFLNTAKNFVIDGTFDTTEFDTTYYIHINNLSDEEITPSPFAPWNQAYVVVTHNEDDSYDYYWVSADKSGFRIDLTADEKIVKGSVYQGENTVNTRQPIGARPKIVIIDENGYTITTYPFYEMSREEAKICYSFKDLSDTEIMLSYYNVDCGTDVIIPGKIGGKLVTSINQYTFNGMNLTSVYIPDSVKTIGSRAFSNNKLTSVYLPSSVTQVDSECFLNNKINQLVIDEGIKTIGQRAFRHNQLTEAVIPDSVTSLGSCAYCDNPIPNPSFLYAKSSGVYDYSKIKGYIGDLSEFPDKVFRIPATAVDANGNVVALKTIESSSFSRVSLQGWEVIIPDTVTTINSSAFWDSGIAKINIPNGVKTIGTSAFKNNRLTEIIIPDSVTSIGEYAFNSNEVPNSKPDQMWIYKRTSSGIDYSTLIGYAGANKANIDIPASKNGVALKTIGKNAFRELNLTGKVTIPSTVTSIEQLSFCQNRLTQVDNGDGNLNGPFIYARKADASIDYTTLRSYGGYNTNVVIPNSVTKIDNYAFYRSFIKGVTLNEGLTTIGTEAFSHNYIKDKVIIPSTVTSIGSNAFYKVISWGNFNSELHTIVNKTGRSFNWKSITGGPSDATFVTGTVENWYGDIEVVAE